ncbi:hypothetical protein ACL1NM_07555 [Corynebacterium striatum]|uniref:hypothetical protein n=1 Tax=Corynebacterium TaxID=1716 RepID=UPI0008A8435E|nr:MULTISPECIES: hypothetical protein [Corynebacterium]MCG7247490.1 hypothetical protein [Corynebacterium simulans]OHO67083.1 hypothetical protein HMPREF2692_06900 [Corynebacterium sp. HMSC036D03]
MRVKYVGCSEHDGFASVHSYEVVANGKTWLADLHLYDDGECVMANVRIVCKYTGAVLGMETPLYEQISKAVYSEFSSKVAA